MSTDEDHNGRERRSARDLFFEAIDIEDAAERSAWLEEACGSDADLRAKVEALIEASASAGEKFLAPDSERIHQALDEVSDTETQQPVPAPGDSISYFGDYELLGEIARGAMGIVYRARQVSLNRIVAVKMVRGTLLSSESDVQRFLIEAEAAAALDHPNIVPIYEVGEHQGQHYFSMKLIGGGTVADRIGEFGKDPRGAARLMATVARAVHAAHQRGILHRDLKPGNILVDGEGEPHVTDFGLAKQLEGESNLTVSGQLMGTPYYMAPEQAEGGAKELTTSADIYSLGAVLYEMLAGRPPFKADSMLETLRQTREEAVPRIASREGGVNRDLETIVLKCVEKKPGGRYASAAALADDLERWLAGKPIEARPVTVVERTLKWVKRKPIYAGFWGVAALSLILLGVGGPIVVFQRKIAVQEKKLKELIQRNLYSAEMNLSLRAATENEGLKQMVHLTDLWIPKEGENDLRGWEWYYLRSLAEEEIRTIHPHGGRIWELVFSPDGEKLAMCSDDRTIRIWDSALQNELLVIGPLDQYPRSISWDPGGIRLICGGVRGLLRMFNAETGEESGRFETGNWSSHSVDWAPGDGRIAAGGGGGRVSVWDTRNHEEIDRIILDSKTPVLGVAWRPDGEFLAAASHGGSVEMWRIENRKQAWKLKRSNMDMQNAVAWRPEGDRLVCGGRDFRIRILEGETGDPLSVAEGHFGWIESIAWSPDGSRVASAGDSMIHLWDADRGRELGVLRGHQSLTTAVAWHPDGGILVSGDLLGKVKAWEAGSVDPIANYGQPVTDIAWNNEGTLLATVCRDGVIRILDPDTGKVELELSSESKSSAAVAWSSDGRRLASTGTDGLVRIWNPQTGTVETVLQGLEGKGDKVIFSKDGNRIFGCSGTALHAWDIETGSEEFELALQSGPERSTASLSPGGRLLVTPQLSEVTIRDANSGKLRRVLEEAGQRIRGFAWSPDERKLAMANRDGTIRIWNLQTEDDPLILRGHSGEVTDLSWSPSGLRLASGGRDDTCRIWDPEFGGQLLTLEGHRGEIVSVRWNPDGRRIATADLEGVVKIWDASRGYGKKDTSPAR